MFKKPSIVLSCLFALALSACSEEEKTSITENLRKVGSPILGEWQIADFAKCYPETQARNIKITAENIELINTTNNTSIIMLENMKQYDSERFIVLSGMLSLYDIKAEKTLAYEDQGDKLVFQGFLANNKLIKRQDLLEKYNGDGNAQRNVQTLDFNYCRQSITN